MGSLEKFEEWCDRNHTHLERQLYVMRKQALNIGRYVELFRTYPANSPEFKVEVEKLYREIGNICDEIREVDGILAEDYGSFVDVLTMMQEELNDTRKRSSSS